MGYNQSMDRIKDKEYPIVSVKTRDGLSLFGLINEVENSEIILINVHGTGSNFFCEEFEYAFYREIPKLEISSLFTNNRGSYAMDSWQDAGACLEIFEDSVKDIDTWIEFAKNKGYKKIILQGHSYGTEKVVYYMNKGKYANDVITLILLGFADSYGTQKNYEKTIKTDLMAEAMVKMKQGKGYELLTGERRAQSGELPISSKTYLNYFSEGSELSKVIPLRNGGSLPMIKNIRVPILAVIGDHDEYTIVPIKLAMDLIKKENKLAKVFQIKGSGHTYNGKQEELIKIVVDFLRDKV